MSTRELAVITGVSRGIGRATALALAKRGVELALLGRPSQRHDQVVAECAARVPTKSYRCDVGIRADIEDAARELLRAQGAPTIVVHNAAVLERGPKVHELEPEAWDHLMAINLRGPFLLSRALIPAMLAEDRGRLLFIASVSGTIGCPQMAHYGASKWGLIGLAKSLAQELKGTNLMSLAILPGSVDTDMLEKTPFPPDMSASEVADVITYYALDAPHAVTGAAVEVYG